MLGDLLQTKLHVPQRPLGRQQHVSRPHLIKQLNQGLKQGCNLTLVSAPAGFGKTTLIAEWVGHLRFTIDELRLDATQESKIVNRKSKIVNQIAWLSLDEGDNDLARFLAYSIAALRRALGPVLSDVERVDAAIGERALGMLQTARPPTEAILTALINEIAALPDRIIFVLDDYHSIDSPPVDDALTFLLDYLPPQMHLVIASRDDPQLPLARLRAGGRMNEIRGADLRFSASEATTFLNQVMGLDLTAEDITALESRTEGWIAGLQLAALALQGPLSMPGQQDAANRIKTFTGSHRFVMDYLIEEVLEQQSESVQTFLLQTAVLNRLSGSLCDALTGQDNGQETLEMLDRANLFIVPLDEERRWYRFHHLFTDLLRQRLHQTQLEQPPILHLRASVWYEQNGFIDEAIEHSLRADDFAQAAQLIEEHIDALWGRGRHRKLQRWLDRLPEEMLFSKPHISVFQARYHCNSGQLDAAERKLKAVEQALDSGTDRALETESQKPISFTHSERMKLRGRIAATRALICSFQGDVLGIIQHGRQALKDLAREDLAWRSVTALTLGNAHGFKGDMTAAYEARYEALQACEAAGNIYLIMLANLELAITLREQGRLQRTIEICQKQMQLASESGLLQTRIVGWLQAVWGETLAELNDLNGSIDRAKKGFQLTERSGDLQMIGWSFICLIRSLFSRGDLVGAEETIQKMENFARESQIPPWIANQMAAWQARLWLAQNKLEAASQWAEDRGLGTGGEPIPPHKVDFFSMFDYLILARILIAQGRLDETSILLQRLLEAAEAGGRTSKVVEIKILQALAFQAGGETDQALSALKRALALAEPEGFIRIFVDEGQPMGHLLHEALSRGIAPEYVRRLLASFSVTEPEQLDSARPRPSQPGLIEPLSEREIEVLQLIAEGLTNPEIAARLYLSLNTVKVHTRNIYGKLDAHSRTQAVATARALCVLPA